MDMMFEAYLTHEDRLAQNDFLRSNEPVWILGKRYSARDVENIKGDIKSRLWFTYRKGFVSIGESGKTTDKGWGCMLRCGQMLIAQALINLHLGRDWRWQIATNDDKYIKILKMFEDKRTAQYSIHQIALTGASEGKQVGDWFGPNTVAQVLKKLSNYDEWSSMAVHVALDNTIVISDARKDSYQKSKFASARVWHPLLLIIPLRLGINEINSVYVKGLQNCFTYPQSLGVIGGRPNHALYFIGCAGNDVIYLDPHMCQSVAPVQNRHDPDKKGDTSYHCNQASSLNILEMDPSVAVSFFCKTEDDFISLIKCLKESLKKEKSPLFEIREDRQVAWAEKGQEAITQNVSRHKSDSDEDFELLG